MFKQWLRERLLAKLQEPHPLVSLLPSYCFLTTSNLAQFWCIATSYTFPLVHAFNIITQDNEFTHFCIIHLSSGLSLAGIRPLSSLCSNSPAFLSKNQSISRTLPTITVKALHDGAAPHRLYPINAMFRRLRLSQNFDSVFRSPMSRTPLNLVSISHLLVRNINFACPFTSVNPRCSEIQGISLLSSLRAP